MAKLVNAMTEAKIYGPYVSKRDGRKRVVLVYPNRTTSMSYARYLYQYQNGPVPDNLEVDHVDDDFTHDELSNYQLLTKVENVNKSRKPAEIFKGICSICGNNFEKSMRNVRGNQEVKQKAGPFCSRSCAGKYNASKQYGHVSQLVEETDLKSVKCEFESHRGYQS